MGWRHLLGEVAVVGDDQQGAGSGPAAPERDVGTASVRLGSHPDAAARARELLRTSLVGVADDVVDRASLLASEVVTNALLHVGAAVEMTVVWNPFAIRVEVADRSPERPEPRAHGPYGLTGRGLHILDELADEWGTARLPTGKIVWFSLRPR